ncbi:squalene synthetase-like protein [Clarireedia jacksonii]
MAAMSLESADLKLKGAEQAEDAQMAGESLPNENERELDGEHTFEASSSFVIDTIGSTPVHTGLSAPRLRSTSPARSDSSEEVILFHGRGQSTARTVETRDDSAMALDPIDAKLKIVEDKLHEQQILLKKALRDKEELLEAYPAVTAEPSSRNSQSILPKRTNKGRRRGRARGRHLAAEDAEDEMIADYIANMEKEQGDGEVDLSFNRRELGGDLGSNDEGAWQDASSVEADGVHRDSVGHGWDRAELEDLDDLSTSDEARGKVQVILSKRERAAGLQYLIVWEDQSVDEARWVSLDVLHDVGALPLIEVFEAEEKLVAQFEDNSDDDSDESDDGDEGDDIDDEADLVQRRIDRMDDEQIARILAKQEELGMGGDEILLFDDDVDDEDDEIDARPIDLNSFILSGKRGLEGKQRRQGEYPRAAALADAYDGFDVMDFERPALKKKPKGRKGKLILDDVSDSELEASMQAAWENDRIKKKERKQEREVLRAQGLLTGKHGKPDLKAKYKEGMGLNAMKEELKQFLMSDNTTSVLSFYLPIAMLTLSTVWPCPQWISRIVRLSMKLRMLSS